MARWSALAGVALVLAGGGVARAQADFGVARRPRQAGQGDGVLQVVQGLGTVGGITTSVAAVVYAIQGRAFGSGWVVATMFSSAICMTAAIQYAASGGGGGEVLAMSAYALLALWPAGWTIWSALSGAEPGELLPPAGKAVPPDDGLRRPLFAPPLWVPLVTARF